MRDEILKRKVEEMKVQGKSLREIVEQMERSGGFGAKNFATGVDILRAMKSDKNCVKFLSFPAAIIATGLRGAIAEALSKKTFDVVITTCGTLDHDLARAFGKNYFHGEFEMDDAKLHKEGINRLGNVLVPNESYGEPI